MGNSRDGATRVRGAAALGALTSATLTACLILGQIGCGNDERVVDPQPVAPALTSSKVDWMQFGGDARHTSNNTLEGALTAQTVGGLKQLFKVSLPAAVESAPVLLTGVSTSSGARDLIFVNTDGGDVVALDANTGATVWSRRNGGTAPSASSPAIDPSRAFVYAYGLDGKVHKYAVADGTETTTGGWPEVTTLKPSVEKCGSALTIATVGGVSYLYAPNGGYGGDAGDYQGHLTTINLGTGAQTVFNVMCSDQNTHFSSSPDCSGQKSALWAKAGVVYDSDTSRIYAVTGNGTYNPGSHFWGDSIVALNPDGTGINGGPLDSYTPSTFQSLQDGDLDLGSTQPAILPGSGTRFPHIAVQSGKDAKLRIVNLDNLSGQAGPGHTAGELFSMNLPQGGEVQNEVATWINPADGSTWVFVASPTKGLAGLQLAVDGSGNPSLVGKWTVAGGSGGAVIANNILYYPKGSSIVALNPTTGASLWSAAIGGIRFQSPVVANGILYVTDDDSNLTAFNLSSGGAPVPASNVRALLGLGALLVGVGLRQIVTGRKLRRTSAP